MYSRTLWAILEATAAKHPDRPALQQPLGGGKYRAWTWREYADIAREIAVGLRAIGVAKGEIVALASETRAEFYLADQGVLACGAIAAALYTSLPVGEQANALRTCGARVAFAETEASARALAVEGIRWILLTGSAPGFDTLESIRAEGKRVLASDPAAFDNIRAEFDDSAYAILYMTSGATGEPKMGLVTHRRGRDQPRHGPACSSAFLRRFDHRVSAFGAHRAARRGGAAAGPRRRVRMVLRRV